MKTRRDDSRISVKGKKTIEPKPNQLWRTHQGNLALIVKDHSEDYNHKPSLKMVWFDPIDHELTSSPIFGRLKELVEDQINPLQFFNQTTYSNWETNEASIVLMNERTEYEFSKSLRKQLKQSSDNDFQIVLGEFLRHRAKRYSLGEINQNLINWLEVAKDFSNRLKDENVN